MKNMTYGFPAVGLVLMLPAVILVSSGLFGFDAPGALIHPVVVIGGLFGALLLNAAAALRFRTEHEVGGTTFAITILKEGKGINWGAVAMALLLLTAIFGYLFVENFRPR